MSVRFKFKNDKEFTALPCDGFHISVLDLKKAIIRLKRFGRVTEFDLEVENQQNGTVFANEEDLIPKNSSLIIMRTPLPKGQQKVWEEDRSATVAGAGLSGSGVLVGKKDQKGSGLTEDERIEAMISDSSEMYDQKNWVHQRGYGRGRGGAFYPPPGSQPPTGYICKKCNKPGHYMTYCTLGKDQPHIRPTTGIPRSFLRVATKDTPGVKINPQGKLFDSQH